MLFLLILLDALLVLFPTLLLFGATLFLVLPHAISILLPTLVLFRLLRGPLCFALPLFLGALLLLRLLLLFARLALSIAASFLLGPALIALALIILI